MSAAEMELHTTTTNDHATHVTVTPPNSSGTTFPSWDELEALISETNHDNLTNEIANALGGIDQILMEYIRITREYEKEELLSGPKMQEIATILSTASTPPSETIFDKLYKRAKLTDNTFQFSSSDTMLHAIFGDRQLADRVIAALFSKYSTPIVSTAWIFWFLCTFLGMGSSHQYFFVGVAFIMQAFLLLFFLSAILSCNIPCLLLILTTFDFWVKIGYSITVAVVSGILFRRWGLPGMWITVMDIAVTVNVLVIIYPSLIEGLHGNWKATFMLGLLLSLFYSLAAILATFNTTGVEEKYLELWFGFSIGLYDLSASCYRVLSLFLWKQTLMAAYTRGKWCICIYRSPYIKWTDE